MAFSRPVKVTVLCTLLYICSSTNNIIGKKLLTKYPYPMTLTLFHMMANSFLMYPALLFAGASTKVNYSRHFLSKYMIPLGLGKLLVSITAHVGIWRISVSYAHTIKASLPIFTMLISRIIHNEKQSSSVLVSLIPILIGIAIATVTELSFEIYGMLSALTGTFILALQNIYTKTALKEIRIGPLQLLMKLAQIALMVCLPLWIFIDTPVIVHDVNLQTSIEYFDLLSRLVLSGIINFFQNVLAFSILQLLSSLSYAVTNATKRILVIIISVITLRNPVSLINFTGMMLAIAGVLCYNRAKIRQNSHRKNVLPTTNTDTGEDLNYVSPRYRAFHRVNSFI